MEVTALHWAGFLVFIVIMLALDLGVFHKKDTVVKVREAILWSIFWIGLALLFNVGLWFWGGKVKALEFFTAYVLEKSLSVDNLFVFLMIFGYFAIPAKYQHKILFWGIFGALIMRAIFIFAGIALVKQFGWVMYIFGAFLIYSGLHMLFKKDDDEDFKPEKNFLLRLFRRMMPVTAINPDGRFFIRRNGILFSTTFFVALLFLEASDVIFAVDSVPAVLSVSHDTFIAFTSNIFAILGLRSLYFALSGVMGYFYYLKYALTGILTFIGVKMCLNELSAELGWGFKISNLVSLAIIFGALIISTILSIIRKRKSSQLQPQA
jgi:tellurite resistance protein TerC